MKVQWNKASMKRRNWNNTLSSKLAGEIDWSINRLIRGKEKGRLKSGLTESGSTVWEEWTAVDRINGKCTKNIEEIRNDGNRIDQLPLSHLYFNSRLQNARVCDLFHIQTHTHLRCQPAPMYNRKGIFHLRLGCPHTAPKGHAQQQWVVLLFAHQTPLCLWR